MNFYCSVILICLSALIALFAIIPTFGFGLGGLYVPGYAFKARGEQAKKYERYVLTKFALFLYTVATLVAAFGVCVHFVDNAAPDTVTGMIICMAVSVVILAAWGAYFYFGNYKDAVRKAKELSE